MKKILIAVALMGLSRTTLMAQADIDLSSLPSDLQAKIKNTQTAAAAAPNPIQQYVTTENQLYTASIKWIAALPSYVSQITGGAASLAVMTKALQNANTSLTTLTAAAPLIDSTNMNLGEANTISDYISENYVYPNACAYQSSVNAPQGCVQPTLTNKSAYAIYPTCNNQQPPIAVFSPAVTVGQFGSGADISVGGNLLGNIVPILTQTINGQNTVVCMSPGTPAPANAVPPAAKK